MRANPDVVLRRFVQRETGSMALFSLFIFLSMLFMAGLAIDLMRHENERLRLQGTADRAVLAAALMGEDDDGPTPEQIARAYFAAEGFGPQLGENIAIDPIGSTGRRVTVYPAARVGTLFSQLIGIDSFDMVTPSRAEEIGGSDGPVEIEMVLVLDTSGSMNSQGKIDALRTAANQLASDILTTPGTAQNAITLVPYHSAVLPPAGWLNAYTNTVGSGPCNDWYSWTQVTNTPSQYTERFNCATNDWRTIRPYLDDPAVAQGYINQLLASGGTRIDTAVRWGATFFDPTVQPMLNTMIMQGLVNSAFTNRPYPWEQTGVMRAMVLLTDGINGGSDPDTISTCNALKAQGVTIYTVAFQAPSQGVSLMQSCASAASHFYNADVSEISAAFQGIVASIQAQALRLTL